MVLMMYCWGDVSSGPFGAQTAFSPVSWTNAEVITDVCCGEQHILFLTEGGSVLSFGPNCKDEKLPGRVDRISDVVSIACGQDCSLALCASGHVFSWRAEGQTGDPPHLLFDSPTPRQVDIPLPLKVIQVACGDSHSLALTTGGDVLSWGLNSHGQLGLGKDVSLRCQPCFVCALTGIAVTQISAGASHTLFLTLPGLVYCCGANKSGQLGLNRVDKKGRFNICMVPALRPLGVSFISCGEAHSAVLTQDGEVFTFGEGRCGQLGHSSTADELRPKLVDGLGGPASQISCGRRHTLVLASSGQLWAFGNGPKGQIGSGQPEDSLIPTLVQLPWVTDAAAIPKDLKIMAGWNTSFIYTSPTLTLDRGQITGRLDETKLQKWQTMGHANCKAEREIFAVFRTCSSLVGSFTKAPGPPLDAGAMTVDLEAASHAFDELLVTPWITNTLENLITKMIHVLFELRGALKSPEILLILLTFPPLQEHSHVISAVLPLAMVIADLNERSLKTLKGWWSSLTPSILLKHILVFKNALAFLLKAGLLETHQPGVKYLLEVLKLLYKVNKAGKSYKVPLSIFYVREIIGNVSLIMDLRHWRVFSKGEDDASTPPIFFRHPFLFPLDCKVAFLITCLDEEEIRQVQVFSAAHLTDEFEAPATPHSNLVFQLSLRRTHVVEDTFRQLAAADHCDFTKHLQVQFADDRRVIEVNKRELFLVAFEELMAPESDMFMFNESKTLAWFPPSPKVEQKTYFLVGVLCGLAVRNFNVVHLPFPLILFKKLLRLKPSLDDMLEFEPVVAESLRCILEDYTPEEVESLDTTFTVTWGGETVELDPKEKGKPVTASNRKEFESAFVNYAFNKSVEAVFEEFKRGFFKVCEMDIIDFFQPEELQSVMVGQGTFDWEEFKQNTVYEGVYHAEHPTIVTFWKVFEKLTAEEKKKFFVFLTGYNRVPYLGMDCLRMTIAVLPLATEISLPECLTCHFLLLLPMYQRYPVERTMETKLRKAIDHDRGFWKEDTGERR